MFGLLVCGALRAVELVANVPVLGDLLFGKAEVLVDYPSTRAPDLCPMCGPVCSCT